MSLPAHQEALVMMAGWTMGIEGWVLMGAWALVMIGAVWLLVQEPRRGTRDDPRAILRTRLARGEISEEEFLRAMAVLEAEAPVAPLGRPRSHAAHPAPDGQEARHD